jgi:hypothetical protein
MITVAQIIRSGQMTVRNSWLASECGIDSSRNAHFLMVLDSRPFDLRSGQAFRGNNNPERGVWHTVIIQNKANLRKGHMNISVFTIKDYKNGPAFGVPENKPNQSQFVFLAGENAKLAELLLSKGRCECNVLLRY